jgi:serine/threonine protein kinase
MATDTSNTNLVPDGYTVIQPLGVGTIFRVTLVRDGQGRDLICKRAAPVEPAVTALALERERVLLGKLRGFAVPELVFAGHDARGGFLVESCAPGRPLRDIVGGENKLTPRELLELASASAVALARLHDATDENGALAFVHGDISPDNVFFQAPDKITFIDLSSALWRDATSPASPGDRGTAPYAAPELLRQESLATQAGDTYALAATLLAVAMGASIVRATNDAGRLYEAATEGVLFRGLDDHAELDAGFRSAIAEALQYEQGRRLTSSREFAARLGPL